MHFNPQLPSEIKVGTRTVKIEVTDIRHPEDGHSVLGLFDPSSQTIYLSDQMESVDVFMETFWHELVHAINDFVRFETELRKEINDADSTAEDAFKFNETFTERFSVTLLQVIRDNNLLPMQ